jgi:hypothetical protein
LPKYIFNQIKDVIRLWIFKKTLER